MKIGFSFGRCIRDIVEGVVDIDDVAVMICRTRIENREALENVIGEYLFRRGYLEGLDKDQCLAVAYSLWDDGKIHQPRMYGVHYASRSDQHLWMDLYPSVTEVSPMVEEAWNQYRMTLGLVHMDRIPTEYNDERDYR